MTQEKDTICQSPRKEKKGQKKKDKIRPQKKKKKKPQFAHKRHKKKATKESPILVKRKSHKLSMPANKTHGIEFIPTRPFNSAP